MKEQLYVNPNTNINYKEVVDKDGTYKQFVLHQGYWYEMFNHDVNIRYLARCIKL